MVMFSSAASTSSRGSASEEGTTGPSRIKNVGSPDGDDERNDFEESHKIQAGIFSVLYILSKEKMNENLKFTVIKLMFDFTQLFALVVNPAHGWAVDYTSIYWQILTFSRWNYIVTNLLGYKAYVAILYTMTGMLCCALALCVWIAYAYKNRSFAYTWPIHVLRVYATIHFGLFDIATLTLIQVSYDCQFLGSGRSNRGNMYTFPEKMCYKPPHLVPFIVGLATQVIFVMAAVIFFTGEFEVNPISRRFTCCAHSHVEVRAFLLKVTMTVVYVVVGWLQVQTAIQAFLCLALTWIFFKNMPYMFAVINHIRVGSYLAVTWTAVLAVAILFKPKNPDHVAAYEKCITDVMLYGLAPIALLGFGASFFRLHTWSQFVRRRFKEAPSGSKVKDIYRFRDPVEVEIISRVARHWIDDEVLDLDRVKEAEAIIKAGLVLFPTRAFMIMLYSNFLWDVLDNPQAGYSQLQAAKKANPNYMERFAIYRREQEHLARTAQTKGNGESTLDLVSYVEFQRNYRLAMRAHREALIATRNFWQYLLQQHITFTHLSKSLKAIESAIVKADKVYRTVLERYPYSAKMIKGYARFLEGVKNDPWRASKFYTEAEKLEAEREEEAAALELEGLDADDSRLLNKVDERVNAVIIINSRGQIQMANKLAYAMFGYNKGELEGKNVAMLMPLPFSQRHNGYIKRHITTGRETVMNRVTDLVALHKDRYVFPFRLAVSKVSGAGDDSLFMGVIMGVEPLTDTANVYILSGGSVAAVDQAFVDWFGYTVEDYLGHPVHTLAVDPVPFKRLVEEVTRHDQPSEDGICPVFLGAKHVLMKHKYTDPVDVSLRLKATGLGTETVYRVEMRRNQLPVELVLTNRKGRIAFITSPLAKALGHTPRSLRKVDIGELLPQPFGAMHAAWIREAAESKPSSHSCRSGVTMVLGPTPKTQQTARLCIKSTDESGEQQHVVKVSPSTLTEGLDERRLRLTVDTSGTVTDVGQSPNSLFGFKPTALLGRSLADCVDVLHAAARSASTAASLAAGGAAADASAAAEVRRIITLLMGRALERPGLSWRVGVMPPLENIRSLGSIATALLAKQTRPAVMELDVKVDLEDLAAGREVSINISLWRADLLCGVLEVDKEGLVLTSQDHSFYPSGLFFGVSSPSLLRQPLARFVQLGGRTIESLFLSEYKSGGKKGALKSSPAASKKVGPLRSLAAHHTDGEPLTLTVQAVRKEGANSRSFVVLHYKEPTRGSRDFLMLLQRGPVEPRLTQEGVETTAPVTAPGTGLPSPPPPAAIPGNGGTAVAAAAIVTADGSVGGSKGARKRRSVDLGPAGVAVVPSVASGTAMLTASPRRCSGDMGALIMQMQQQSGARSPGISAPTAGQLQHLGRTASLQQTQQSPPQSPLPGTPMELALAASTALMGVSPPMPQHITLLKTSTGSGGGGSSGDSLNLSTPPKDDSITQTGSVPLDPSLPALPLPPPPQRVIATPSMDQPRVVAAGRTSFVAQGPAPATPAAAAALGSANRWSMAPVTPHNSGVKETIDVATAAAAAASELPPGVVGLTLQDYLVGRSDKSEDDLAALFDRAVSGSGAGDGSGGEVGGAFVPPRPQQRPSVRRVAPNMRPVGLSNLSFNRRLREKLAVEAAAISTGICGGNCGHGTAVDPSDDGDAAAAVAPAVAAFVTLRPGSPVSPPPAPSLPLPSTPLYPPSGVHHLVQQFPAAAAGLNALTAAVARATTPPPMLQQPTMAPASPHSRPPIQASLSLPTSITGMLTPEPQLPQLPPPTAAAVAYVINVLGTDTSGGTGRSGSGGSSRLAAALPLALPSPPPPPLQPPPPPRNPSDLRALTVQRSFSRDSVNSGSGINHPGRVTQGTDRGAGQAAAAMLPYPGLIGNTAGQGGRRSLSTKQVSFAPSQLLIDETGKIERQPSLPQISLPGRASFTREPGCAPPLLEDEPYIYEAADGSRGARYLAQTASSPLQLSQYTSASMVPLQPYCGGAYGHLYGFVGSSEEAFGTLVKSKSNIKLARIREWVLSEGERYFRLEDVQDVGDTVYPFGPDLLQREDSSHALVLNGGAGEGEFNGDDEAEAAPSRWAEADGGDDANDVQSLDDEIVYNNMLLDSTSRDIMRGGGKDGKFGGGSASGGGQGDSDGDEHGGGSSPGGGDDGSDVGEDDDGSRSNVSNSTNQQSSPATAAGVASSSAQADFRRGKRCRKLLKMLSTPAVQRATLAFRWQALLAIAVQLLANLACFVLLTVLLIRQTRGLTELNDVGQTLVSCHDAMLSLQVMDNIYSNRAKERHGLYDKMTISRLEKELKSALDSSWYSHNDVYLGHNSLNHLPTTYNLSALWNDYNHQELLFYGPNATDQRSTSLWRLGNSFLRQGFELHHRHRELGEQLGTLAASDQYKYIHSNGLFELFRGYSMTLNAFVFQAVDTSNTINRLQLVLLVIEGCCICALVVAYMAWLLKKVDNQRYGMYGVFLIVPVGLVRGLASKTVAVEAENSDGEEESPEDQAAEDLGGMLPQAHPPVGHGGDHGGMRINMDAGGGGPGGGGRRNSRTHTSGSLRSLYDRMAFWRHGSVRHGKRTMLRNSKESLWLLAPFVVWGLVVVIMHSLGYVTMEQASAPVAMTNVVNTVLTRVHRVVYFAQELSAADSSEAQRALYPVLESEVMALKAEWEVMLYGANSSQATDRHYHLARRGIAFEMGLATKTLFSSGVTCWMPDSADCYPPSHPYAAVVYRGLNAMMQRFFLEADLMLRDSPSAWTLNSSRLDYLFHEGTGNLHWAMFRLTEVHLDSVVALYMRVEVFHVVVFVLSWLLAGLFLFGMLRPFMGHTQRETERIAEMLSQLPADVDVEGLLNKALISIKGEASTSNRGGDQRAGRNRVVPMSVPFEVNSQDVKGAPRPVPSFTKSG